MKTLSAVWRPLGILLFVTMFAIGVKFPLEAFSSGYDPYYHAAHATALLAGEEFSYPVFTYFSDYPADPWFGYHVLMGWNQQIWQYFGHDAITASILFHALLSGIVFATLYWFFLVAYRKVAPLYQKELQKKGAADYAIEWSAESLALLTVGLTLLLHQEFIFRTIIIERPHLLMITLTLLITIGVLTKRNWLVFASALVAPLLYSLPMFLALPFVAFGLGWLLVSKRLVNLKPLATPLLMAFSGLVLGVALHPDSIGYLVNGIGFHAFAIFQSFFGLLPFLDMRLVVPAEMGFTEEFPGIVFLVVFTVILSQCYNRNLEYKSDKPDVDSLQARIYEVGFGRMAALLIVASLLINRISEYAAPVSMLVFVSYSLLVLYPLGRFHLDRLSRRNADVNKTLADVAQKLTRIRQNIVAKVLFSVFILYALLGHTLNIHESAFKFRLAPDRFAGAAAYLTEHSSPTDITLLAEFGYYPQLVYHQPSIKASVGMDDRMVFFKDKALARDINEFTGFTVSCQTTDCVIKAPQAIPNFITERNVGHVLVDAKLLNEKSVRRIDSFEFLRMVYTDEHYPDVRVYEVVN